MADPISMGVLAATAVGSFGAVAQFAYKVGKDQVDRHHKRKEDKLHQQAMATNNDAATSLVQQSVPLNPDGTPNYTAYPPAQWQGQPSYTVAYHNVMYGPPNAQAPYNMQATDYYQQITGYPMPAQGFLQQPVGYAMPAQGVPQGFAGPGYFVQAQQYPIQAAPNAPLPLDYNVAPPEYEAFEMDLKKRKLLSG